MARLHVTTGVLALRRHAESNVAAPCAALQDINSRLLRSRMRRQKATSTGHLCCKRYAKEQARGAGAERAPWGAALGALPLHFPPVKQVHQYGNDLARARVFAPHAPPFRTAPHGGHRPCETARAAYRPRSAAHRRQRNHAPGRPLGTPHRRSLYATRHGETQTGRMCHSTTAVSPRGLAQKHASVDPSRDARVPSDAK